MNTAVQTRPMPATRLARVLSYLAFPWQGAVLVLCLTAGATVHQHPSALRGLIQTTEHALNALPL